MTSAETVLKTVRHARQWLESTTFWKQQSVSPTVLKGTTETPEIFSVRLVLAAAKPVLTLELTVAILAI